MKKQIEMKKGESMHKMDLLKTISVLLAVLLLSAACFALADDASVAVDLSAQSGTVLITEGGVYTLKGTLSGGQVVIEAPKEEKVELILAGAEISSSSGAAVECRQAKDLIITLADGTVNTLSDSQYYPAEAKANAALFSQDDLKIRGNGTLNVQGNNKHGIATKDDLKIEGGVITVTSVSDAVRGKDSVTIEDGVLQLQAGKDGISATEDQDETKGWIEISGGSISITSAGDGIQAETSLKITGGDFEITTQGRSTGTSDSQKGIKAKTSVTIDDGRFILSTSDDAIHCDLDVTISGGDFEIESEDDGVHAATTLTVNGGTFHIPDCYEGFEGTEIVINGGTVWIDSRDDAIGAAAGTVATRAQGSWGGNPSVAVTINGGSIEAVSGGDTVDSNGNIFVNGGRLRLNSPATPYYEGCLLCNGRVTVTGGDIAFVGNIGVELTVENQPMLLVSYAQGKSSGSVVSLRDADGQVVLETLARKNFTQSVFSSPEMQIGETYSVYVDDDPIIDVTLTGAINKAADDGGTFTGGYPRGHW